MREFETLDINNKKCRFQYSIEQDGEYITFRVFSIPMNELEWFQYTVKIINSHLAKSETFTHNYKMEFSKKGIPEKIVEIASNYLKRSIVSSPKSPKPGDFIIPAAIKAWDRLILQNSNARYDKANDCFILEWK